MARNRKTFNVAKYKLKLPDNTALTSFELEELEGEEECAAAERAGEKPSGLRVQMQFLAESIVAVNGKPVDARPFTGVSRWPSRTLDFVRKAFHRFCSASNKELEDFERAEFGDADPVLGERD